MNLSDISNAADVILYNETRKQKPEPQESTLKDCLPVVSNLSAKDALDLAKLIVAAQKEWHEEMAQDPDNGAGWKRDGQALAMALEILDIVELWQ